MTILLRFAQFYVHLWKTFIVFIFYILRCLWDLFYMPMKGKNMI
jgi:hypothetical protein